MTSATALTTSREGRADADTQQYLKLMVAVQQVQTAHVRRFRASKQLDRAVAYMSYDT